MRTIAAATGLALTLAACAAGTGTSTSTPDCPAPAALVSPGEPVPDCTLEGMFGAPALTLRDLSGQPVLINFWASWCTFCIKEMPDFQEVYEAIGDRVEFVGVNFLGGRQGETRPAAERFAQQTGVRYPLVYDPEGVFYSHFSTSVLRPLMPLTVFVSPDGTVAERHFGPLDADGLREKIAEHLGVA